MQTNSYSNFFLQHVDFAIEYISLRYPFTVTQVSENMPYLIKGDAFYPEFIPDLGGVMHVDLGLSYNRNIHWTLALKRQWKIGWQTASPDCCSEYGGYYDPENGSTIVWGNTTPETLFDIIPLDWYREKVGEEQLLNDYYNGQGGVLEEITAEKVYPKLTPAELVELYQYDRELVLYNNSIWEHTVKDVLTYDLVMQVILAVKQRTAIAA